MIDSYRKILERADRHFDDVFARQRQHLQCGRGCSFCCYGLFEIGAADIPLLAQGLQALDGRVRRGIVNRARRLLTEQRHPDLRECSAEEKKAFFDRTAGAACPNLSRTGECLVYESRPLICRTFGLPIRDGDRYIGDICDLNFTRAGQGDKDAAAWDLQWEDAIGPEDEYTIPEAIVLIARMRGW
jgi:Fe-S-cluster containining protein